MSEHEGFCAPIPESYYLNIPVVAFNAGAVKETMNNGGVLINKKDFVQTAALLDHIIKNSHLRKKILKSQQESLKKYFKNKTGKILLDYVRNLT
jgi:glycosyltransferase involved in cell wall biosynthesis